MKTIEIDYQATATTASLWYVATAHLGVSPQAFIMTVAAAMFAWHNGLGALIRRLHADRNGSWAPWCGFRAYLRQVEPVIFAAALFFGLWAFGAFVLGF